VQNLYIYELAKIRQAELEERAREARLVGIAVRARKRLGRPSAHAPAVTQRSNRMATDRIRSDQADLSSAGPTRR
jgi:hypothetical protein